MLGNTLRRKIPTSQSRFFSRTAPFDLAWAACSPILAFLIRDGAFYRIDNVAIYCGIAFVVSIAVFQWFRISSPISSFFSAYDALKIAQACLTAVGLTAAILFTFTRLEEAPRSVPVLHFFVLVSGLLCERALSRLIATRQTASSFGVGNRQVKNVLVIGASRLAWFFTRMVDEFSYHEVRVVAVLDEKPWLHLSTRSMDIRLSAHP